MGTCLSYLSAWCLPEGIPYAEAKKRIASFDLVYFCQLDTWTGPWVALFGGKLITHMGVCVRDEATGNIFVLESVRHADTSCDVADHERVHTGVRLVRLEETLRHRLDTAFICVQPILMSESVRREAEAQLPEFIRRHVNVPFESSPSCFVRAQLDRGWWGYAREDTSSLFCSELAALTLRCCGLLTGVTNVSAIWHTMFWTSQLTLCHGARLSEQKYYVQMLPRRHRKRVAPQRAPPPAFLAAVPAPAPAALAATPPDELLALAGAPPPPPPPPK